MRMMLRPAAILAATCLFSGVSMAQVNVDAAPEDSATEVEEPAVYPEYKWKARIMTGYEYKLEKPAAAQGGLREQEQNFFIKQARFGLDADLTEQISAELSFELSDALTPKISAADMDTPAYLRDASLDIKFVREFRLRAGRYKRPVSELQLTSVSKLSVPDRGLLNALLLEDNEWGDRAVGAMLFGKLRWAKAEWALSVTNSAWSPAFPREGIDILARLQASPFKGLSVGINGGRKTLEFFGEELSGYGLGADIKLRVGNGQVLVEGLAAEQLFELDQPTAFGALLLADYDFPLNSRLTAQPTVFFEFADAHSDFSQTEAVRGVLGFNLILDQDLRFMPRASITKPLGTVSEFNPWPTEYEYMLMLSLDI